MRRAVSLTAQRFAAHPSRPAASVPSHAPPACFSSSLFSLPSARARQLRCFSLSSLTDPVVNLVKGGGSDTGAAAAAAATTASESTKRTLTPEDLALAEEEEIKRLIDEEMQYAEPDMTLFEYFDQTWDTAMELISPLRWCDKGMRGLHDSLGWEWWAAIAFTSFAARLLLLPLQLFVTRNGIRMAKQTNALANTTLTEKEKALVKNNYQAQIDALAVKGGYRKWISYLSFFSVIPYGVVFYTTRTLMADEAVIAQGGGGCLWFPEITAADSTYILPLLSWLFMSATNEMTMAQSNPSRSSSFLIQKWGSRVATAVFLIMFRGSEAGIMLGFVMSGLMNALPPLILRTKWFREKFSVPRIKPPPRSNMELGDAGGLKQRIRQWMAGSTFDENATLGGGMGQVAHAQTAKVENLSSFKIKPKGFSTRKK